MAEQDSLVADAIDASLEAGDFEQAQQDLQRAAPDREYEVLRIKLALYDGSLPPGAAMQKLIQMMRVDPDAPRAKELYQVASNMAYTSRESSVSHSHPPPPVTTGPDEQD